MIDKMISFGVQLVEKRIVEGFKLGRKPDLVCIGAQKSGTSWLHEVLSERPDVWVPPFKELHFFSHKFDKECRSWTEWHIKKGVKTARSRHLKDNLNPDINYLDYLDSFLEKPMFNGTWYKNVFSRAPISSLCLDVTPAYSSISQDGVSFVAKFLGKAKFIYIIRTPLDRALSQLRMEISRTGIPSTKEEWKNYATMPVIISRGDYKSNIPRWSKHFDSSRLLFIPFQQISQSPYEALNKIETFAGLTPFNSYKKATKKAHQSKLVSIPEFVIDILREETMEQDQFLKEYFGTKFMNPPSS